MVCETNDGQKDLSCELDIVDSYIALGSVVEIKHSNLYLLLFVVSTKGWILVGSCSKIVWCARKCTEVTLVNTFIKNVDYTFIFYQHMHLIEWNMKKESFKNKQV